MKRLQRASVLTALAEKLRGNGSWCGETHIQKAAFVLQELMGVPTGFYFILYKHGPFSFDLRDELTEMRADGLMELVPQPYPYGPSLHPTKRSEKLRKQFSKTIEKNISAIEFVARKLGNKDVAELESLSTALLVTHELEGEASPEDRAKRLHELKPHLDLNQASSAVEEIDGLIHEAQPLNSD